MILKYTIQRQHVLPLHPNHVISILREPHTCLHTNYEPIRHLSFLLTWEASILKLVPNQCSDSLFFDYSCIIFHYLDLSNSFIYSGHLVFNSTSLLPRAIMEKPLQFLLNKKKTQKDAKQEVWTKCGLYKVFCLANIQAFLISWINQQYLKSRGFNLKNLNF